MNKHRAAVITVVILLLAAGVGATVLKKHAEPGAAATPASGALPAATLEFLASDVAQAKPHDLRPAVDLDVGRRGKRSAFRFLWLAENEAIFLICMDDYRNRLLGLLVEPVLFQVHVQL